MNFDDAIKAHSSWKMKLQAYIAKPDGSLKVADISPDNKCSLGQWIHGEGAKHSALPEYQELKAVHAEFHKAAADVVKRADAGEKVTEEVMLGGKSKYAEVSTKVVSLIMKMKAKAS